MKKLNDLTIIGGGSWATALVRIFSASEIQVKWYLRSSDAAKHIQWYGRNPNYLSFLQLSKEYISPVSDIQEAIQPADYVLFAVPSAFLGNKNLLVSIKGMVRKNSSISSAFLEKRLDISPGNQVAPGCKTYLKIASENTELAKTASGGLHSGFIKTIINNNPLGVEISAVLKNIIGMACSIANRLNYAVAGIHKMMQKLKTNQDKSIVFEMLIISAVYRILYNKMLPYIELKLLEPQLFQKKSYVISY